MVSSNSRFQAEYAGHRFLVEQLLDAVLELVGLVLADVFEPRPVVAERRILHGGFEHGVVEPIELEREEQEMRGGGRDPLLHVAVEFGARGIDGVAGMDEAGIGNEPAEQIVERLVALHRLRKRLPRPGWLDERCELALIGLLEGNALRVCAIEIALHPRIIDPGIEIGKIPFRQRADAGGVTEFGYPLSGGAFCWCGHDRVRGTDDRGATTSPPERFAAGGAAAAVMHMALPGRGSTPSRAILKNRERNSAATEESGKR